MVSDMIKSRCEYPCSGTGRDSCFGCSCDLCAHVGFEKPKAQLDSLVAASGVIKSCAPRLGLCHGWNSYWL